MIQIQKGCWVPLRLPKEEMTDEEFFVFSATNKELRIERDANKQIVARLPSDGQSAWQRSRITFAVEEWRGRHRTGAAFGSGLGCSLPNGLVRDASASWITSEKRESLSSQDKNMFLPFAPDFVVELPSFMDTPEEMQARMQEWMTNGVRLGWLIAPEQKLAFIYRADGTVDKVEGFDKKLSGEDVLPGFEFDLSVLL